MVVSKGQLLLRCPWKESGGEGGGASHYYYSGTSPQSIARGAHQLFNNNGLTRA
jgi:hypothetical protein